MKKTINENTLKSIIKESLKNYLKESMDSELGMGEETEGWTPEMDDMWDEFGNNNIHDTGGAFGVLAQGDDDDHISRVAKSLRSTKFDTDANMDEFEDEADEFASDDNAEYLHDKMFESIVRKSINESFNRNTNMGKIVKLTESELKNIISEAVMKILNESVEEGALGNLWNRATNGKDIKTYANNLQKVIDQFNKVIKNATDSGQETNPKYAMMSIQSLQNLKGAVEKGDLSAYNSRGTIQAISSLNKRYGTNIQLPQAAPQQQQTAQPQQGVQQQRGQMQQPQQNMQQQQSPQNSEEVKNLMLGAKDYAKELKLYNAGKGGYDAFNDLMAQCKRICGMTGQNPNELVKDVMASVYV